MRASCVVHVFALCLLHRVNRVLVPSIHCTATVLRQSDDRRRRWQRRRRWRWRWFECRSSADNRTTARPRDPLWDHVTTARSHRFYGETVCRGRQSGATICPWTSSQVIVIIIYHRCYQLMQISQHKNMYNNANMSLFRFEQKQKQHRDKHRQFWWKSEFGLKQVESFVAYMADVGKTFTPCYSGASGHSTSCEMCWTRLWLTSWRAWCVRKCYASWLRWQTSRTRLKSLSGPWRKVRLQLQRPDSATTLRRQQQHLSQGKTMTTSSRHEFLVSVR